MPWWVALVAALVFANTLVNRFAHDDHAIVERNPRVVEQAPAGDIFANPYWPPGYPQAQYRPLTIVTFRLQHALHGLTPWPYHLVNVLLFALLSAGVTALFLELGVADRQAWLAALLFAVHPLHVEAVAPVVGRSELLAGLGIVGGLLAALRYGAATATAARFGWGSITVLVYATGLLSKENTIVLPALIVAHAWLYRPRWLRGTAAWWLLVPLGLVAIAFVWIHFGISGGWSQSRLAPEFEVHNPLLAATRGDRWLTALLLLGRYLRLFVVPYPLICDYTGASIPLVRSPLDPRWIVSLVAITLAAVGIAWLLGRARSTLFAAALFGLSYLPVSQLLFATGIVMGERLMLVPSVGLCLILTSLIDPLDRRIAARARGRPLEVLLLGVLVLFAALTIHRNRDWYDSATLAFHDVRTNPRSPVLNYVCSVFANDGRRLEEARTYAERAVRMGPDFASAHLALGVAAFNLGDLESSRAHLERAAAIRPSNQKAPLLLAVIAQRTGDTTAAIGALERLLELDPNASRARQDLASLLVVADRPAEAETLWRAMLEEEPGSPVPYLTAVEQLARGGYHASAKAWFVEGLERMPDTPGLRRAWVELTGRLIVGGDLAAARDLLETLTALEPDNVGGFVNLASVRRRQGDGEAARVLYQRVLELAPGTDHAHLAREQLERLGPAPGERLPQP